MNIKYQSPVPPPPRYSFTERDNDELTLLAQKYTSKEISKIKGVAADTVRKYLRKIEVVPVRHCRGCGCNRADEDFSSRSTRWCTRHRVVRNTPMKGSQAQWEYEFWKDVRKAQELSNSWIPLDDQPLRNLWTTEYASHASPTSPN